MQQEIAVQDIIEKFAEKDIRLTPQRISVYKFLLENRIHPTVDTVYCVLKKENPSLSKTTIYNTIDVLSNSNLIRVIRVGEGDVRLDGYTHNHGHFYCKKCGQVFDFSLEGCHMPDALDGFQTDSMEVLSEGICKACAKSMKNDQ